MVSRQYICDRCGKERTRTMVDLKVGDRLVRDIGWIAIKSKSGFEMDLDLCEDCMNDFVKWFENEKGNGGVNE